MSAPVPNTQYYLPIAESGDDLLDLLPPFKFDATESEVTYRVQNALPIKLSTTDTKPNLDRTVTCNFFKTESRVLKTQICRRFSFGSCGYGDKCIFSHDIGDIKKFQPQWQRLVGRNHSSFSVDEKEHGMNSGMKFCREFYKGEKCPYGSSCRFLHESSIDSKALQRKSRFCWKWKTLGSCPYAEKCCFAHGQAEMQKPTSCTQMESMYVRAAGSNTNPSLANDASATGRALGANFQQVAKSKRFVFNTQKVKKIRDIYADWIDEIQLIQTSDRKIAS